MSTVLFSVLIPATYVNKAGATIKCLESVEKVLDPITHDYVVLEDTRNKKFELVFPAHRDLNAEKIMAVLEEIGVGHDFGSISMSDLAFGLPKGPTHPDQEVDNDLKESVTSRLVIHQLLQETEDATAFSFDYILLCIMGSIIATMGLAIASPAIIVASMLVSPILGPILATSLGSILCDWRLFSKGMYAELGGLALCVGTGFLTGTALTYWGDWLNFPTVEMTARGEPYSGLIIGAFIAFPSGIGVGLSVLGSNMPALIGVAISASLLPPAANCGMFFAYGIFGELLQGKPVDSAAMFEQGAVSLAITILNIICIYFASVLIFRIKEVVPMHDKSKLWRTFIPEVRRQNQSKSGSSRQFKIDQILKESDAGSRRMRYSSVFGGLLAAQDVPVGRNSTSAADSLLTMRDRSLIRTHSIAMSRANAKDSHRLSIGDNKLNS